MLMLGHYSEQLLNREGQHFGRSDVATMLFNIYYIMNCWLHILVWVHLI